MSVRAYKIKKIETEKTPTFNVWEEFEWIEGIAHYKTFNDNGECQSMEFDRDRIEEKIADEKDKHKLDILNAILSDCGDIDSAIEYMCY